MFCASVQVPVQAPCHSQTVVQIAIANDGCVRFHDACAWSQFVYGLRAQCIATRPGQTCHLQYQSRLVLVLGVCHIGIGVPQYWGGPTPIPNIGGVPPKTQCFRWFLNSEEKVELDFSSGTFCDKSPKAQVRNGLFYLPNQEEPYSGENLCVYLSNGQYYSKGEIKNGLRTSKWTYWKENGQREKVEYYKDGESVGEKMVSMQLFNARALYLSYAADSNNVGAYDKLIKEHPSSSYVDQATLLMAKNQPE